MHLLFVQGVSNRVCFCKSCEGPKLDFPVSMIAGPTDLQLVRKAHLSQQHVANRLQNSTAQMQADSRV